DQSIELIGRKGLQIAASDNEQRREIKQLRAGEGSGGQEPKEGGQQREIFADGFEQHVQQQRQRNIAQGLDHEGREAQAVEKVEVLKVRYCSGSVARHDELRWNVSFTKPTRHHREQEKDSGNLRGSLYLH